jgi:tRNA A37 threonylcarbamoyladenosine biosynthesis protein TsaE
MRIDDIYSKVATEKPQIIYLTGKTCTGKSTFSRQLSEDIRYKIIELDEVVLSDLVAKQGLETSPTFEVVYKENPGTPFVDAFIGAVQQKVEDALLSHELLVIEGAVGNAQTLAALFKDSPEFSFIYFHPENLDIYIRNLTSRFMLTNKEYGAPDCHEASGIWLTEKNL